MTCVLLFGSSPRLLGSRLATLPPAVREQARVVCALPSAANQDDAGRASLESLRELAARSALRAAAGGADAAAIDVLRGPTGEALESIVRRVEPDVLLLCGDLATLLTRSLQLGPDILLGPWPRDGWALEEGAQVPRWCPDVNSVCGRPLGSRGDATSPDRRARALLTAASPATRVVAQRRPAMHQLRLAFEAQRRPGSPGLLLPGNADAGAAERPRAPCRGGNLLRRFFGERDAPARPAAAEPRRRPLDSA